PSPFSRLALSFSYRNTGRTYLDGFPGSFSSPARCFTSSCTGVTVTTTQAPARPMATRPRRTNTKYGTPWESDHERQRPRLRPLVAGYHQLGRIHLLRLQLLQAADETRMALVRRLQRLHRRAVRRNVWLPADHLSSLRLAAESLPRRELVLP